MSNKTHNKEIEVRFLDIDVDKLKKKLISLGAIDEGEDFLTQIIFYDEYNGQNKANDRFVRLRKTNKGILLTYKHLRGISVDQNEEIEFYVGDLAKAKDFVERVGFHEVRREEKKRHTYTLDGAEIDFDTWPNVPTYIEIEAESEKNIKDIVKKLGLNWADVVIHNAGTILENYGIPVKKLKYFTFDKVE